MTVPKLKIVPAEEEKDLGFGAVVASERKQRLLNRDGSFNVSREGLGVWEALNPYHSLLTMSWPKFFGLLTGTILLLNTIFAVLYLLCGEGALAMPATGMPEGRFLQAFFFSVETFATIGYGHVYPIGIAANSVMTIESIVGLIAVALTTGIMFARFSRPTARIRFSQRALIAPYRGITAFEFRLANVRASQMVNLEAKVLFSRFGAHKEKRDFADLALERRQVALFPLSWTIVHPIDETSPLYGLTAEDLASGDAEFLVMLSGYDETFATTVHTRTSYKPDEIDWGVRFASVYEKPGEDGMIKIDVGKLDETIPG